MLEVGDRVTAARVFTTPLTSATLHELVADRPILLFFYLFDWTST